MTDLRLGLEHSSGRLGFFLDRDDSVKEKHIVTFERYVSLPSDLQELRSQSKGQEDWLNPWVITDIDNCLEGNPFLNLET